ncbi:MAG: hypothetical protein WBE44_03745 [Terriglobales bacterium]|jgi:hypothetical protein
MKKTAEVCAFVFFLLTLVVGQQASTSSHEVKSINTSGDLMSLNVADIEAEINYSDRPLATIIFSLCEALNWSYSADWADGQITPPSADNTVSHINDKGYRLRNRGTYSLWFSHEYQTANTTPGYMVVLHDDGQCAGLVYPIGVFHNSFPSTTSRLG